MITSTLETQDRSHKDVLELGILHLAKPGHTWPNLSQPGQTYPKDDAVLLLPAAIIAPNIKQKNDDIIIISSDDDDFPQYPIKCEVKKEVIPLSHSLVKLHSRLTHFYQFHHPMSSRKTTSSPSLMMRTAIISPTIPLNLFHHHALLPSQIQDLIHFYHPHTILLPLFPLRLSPRLSPQCMPSRSVGL